MRLVWMSAALLFITMGAVSGQNAIRIGDWRMHLPYNVGVAVTQSESRVFYASEKALFSIRKDSVEDVRFYSKIEGLNDIGITLLEYQEPRHVIVAVYENSNIDLIYNDGIINVNNILDNNTIVGSKRINDVWVNDDDLVFFSCDFGLVEFDLSTGKFGFTMFTGTPVRSYEQFEGAYVIATDEGLYKFDSFDTELVSNFDAWEHLGPEYDLPSSYEAQDVAVYQGQLFAAVDHSLYALDGGSFLFWDELDDREINFLSAEGAHLKVGYVCPNQSCAGRVLFYNSDGYVGDHGFQCVGSPVDAIEDQEGRVWYADNFNGVRYAGNYQWGCNILDFNTPYSSNVSEIAVKDNVIYIAAGGVSDTYNKLSRPDGYFTFGNNDWWFQNRTNNDQLAEYDPLDYFRILPHPEPDSPIVYVGSYHSGLLEYHQEDSTYKFYDQTNSALEGAVGDQERERVAGMDMDAQGNLWMTCYLAPHPLVVRKADGTWKNFSVPSSTFLGHLEIDQRGYKWVAIISGSEGLLVFDDGGTIDNTGDDRFRVFRTTNSNLPTNSLTNLTMDHLGDIWVGTSEGPVVFDGSVDPFEGTNHGYRITVEQDGILSYLLAEEQITTIAIDGANQKWIGTNNGVFVQSPNGEEQIATYNVDNSPLLDNRIIDIAINPYDGEAFIGTASGVVSTRGEAIAGTARHQSNAYAFPNPVTPDYDGPIAIRGLAENAAVKITDVAGIVVYETRAQGGQAIWDGKDLSGRTAQSGVYLVFSTTEDTFDKPDAIVTKILKVN